MRLTPVPQQDEQPPIAEPAALVGKIAQTGAQPNVGRPARQIADHLTISGYKNADPALANLQDVAKMSDSFALGDGCYHFLSRAL